MIRLIPDQPFVRLFPSRRRFALSRLIAFAVLRVQCLRRPPQSQLPYAGDQGRGVLAIDRDQDAIETYSVGILHTVVCTSFLAAQIPVALPLAVLLAALIEPPLVLLCCFITGGLIMPRWMAFRRQGNDHFAHANGVVLMALAAAASIWMVQQPRWLAPIGTIFLAIVILNACASVVVRLLSRTIDRWEQRCVA